MSRPTEDVFGKPTEAKPVAVTETPEFKAAIDAAKDGFRAEMAAMLAAMPGIPAAGGDLRGILQEMAGAIAEMSYQGNKKDRPVDPKVLATREEGRRQLDAMLDEIKARVHALREVSYDSEEEKQAAVRAASPKYRVTSKIHFNEILIDPFRMDPGSKMAVANDIYWLGEPNHALRPLNDIAKKLYAKFVASRGTRSAIEKASVKPVWMTDNGLIMEGVNMPARREVSQPIFNDDMDFPVARDPSAPTINVLGTIHEPAVMNYHNKPI